MDTWRKMILDELKSKGLSWDDIEACTLSSKELDREFDAGYGGTEGSPFTAWTADYVLFPTCYDGSEWVESVPRNPCSTESWHVGGG